MACVIVPTVEAVITTAVAKNMERKGKTEVAHKLGYLNKMLWGGSALLTFEHVWHGEITPWFPFLTAAANKHDTQEMFHEMSTVGVSMACLVTLSWVGLMVAYKALVKRADKNVDVAVAHESQSN